jgi:rhodanese-related sulfurtransferase|nr:rhodanese-like domain-containing protein [uncultured Caldimonas sp.]
MLRELSVQDVRRLIDTAEAEAAPVLLDVREPWEFSLAAIRTAGADTLHIPMREIPARLAEIDPQRTVICVCHHGMRSLQVAHFLLQQGFEEVINLQGGIDAWSEQVDPNVPRY